MSPGVVGPTTIRRCLSGFDHVTNDELAVHILKVPKARVVNKLRVDRVCQERAFFAISNNDVKLVKYEFTGLVVEHIKGFLLPDVVIKGDCLIHQILGGCFLILGHGRRYTQNHQQRRQSRTERTQNLIHPEFPLLIIDRCRD